MERLTDLLGRYLEGQVAAGADAVQIFDSWAGALTPHDYAHAVLPHFDRLVRRVQATGVPVIAFARGNANLLEVTREIPADVVGIDWSIELDRAIEVVGRDRVVQGNLDPMILLGSPEVLVERTQRVLAQGMGARAHVFNLGHGISRFTDPRQVALLVETVHAGVSDAQAARLLDAPARGGHA
jgi:uroporphyrinogen decarboxylase